MSTSSEKTSFDPSRRRLCPDGACIGLLDESGRCKECGLVAGGKGPAQAPAAAVRDAADDAGQGEDVEQAEGADDAGEVAPSFRGEDEPTLDAATEDTAAFDPKRKLCPDGACVGVIGPDGRCTVCGQAAEG